MNCPKCNAANNPDARFCGSCGFDMSSAQQQNLNNQPEEVLDEQPTMEPINQPVVDQPVMEQSVMPEQTMNNQPMMNQPMNNEVPQAPQEPLVNFNAPQNNMTPQPKKSKTLPIILGVVGAVIAVVICVILLLNMSPSEERKEKQLIDDIFNPKQLIKVKSNTEEKYGYINTEGKFVIEAKYDDATDFKGDYAVVRAEVETEGLTRSVYQIIDKKGKVKKQANLNIEYIDDNGTWIIDGELYNEKMKKVSPAGVRVSHKEENYYLWVNDEKKTAGVMNEKGKATYTYTFQEGEDSIYLTIPSIDETLKEKYCVVNIEEKYGIINCDTGVVVHELSETRVSSNTDNVFELKDPDTYAFKEIMYIQNDKKMYQSTNELVDLYYYPGYVSIRDGSKDYSERYTYLHTATGEIKNERPSTSYDDDDDDEEDITNEWEKYTGNKAFSCGDDGYGLMNNEKITLPCEWEDLEYLEVRLYKYLKANKKEYIYGEKDDKWYLISIPEKKAIFEFNASRISKKEESTFVYYTDKDTSNKKVYNLLTNKSLNVDSEQYLTVYSNYITVKDYSDKILKYYNTNLECIYKENL